MTLEIYPFENDLRSYNLSLDDDLEEGGETARKAFLALDEEVDLLEEVVLFLLVTHESGHEVFQGHEDLLDLGSESSGTVLLQEIDLLEDDSQGVLETLLDGFVEGEPDVVPDLYFHLVDHPFGRVAVGEGQDILDDLFDDLFQLSDELVVFVCLLFHQDLLVLLVILLLTQVLVVFLNLALHLVPVVVAVST